LNFEGRSNLVDPDEIARRLSPADPALAAIAAAREAITRCQAFLASQTSFAVETTLAGTGTLAMMREAKAAGFVVRLLFIALYKPEMNIHRVRIRARLGGHDVPDTDIRRRYARSLDHAAQAFRMADDGVVFDNSGLAHQRMLEIRNGKVTWRANTLPDWVADLDRQI
jgi:predicted ABC-type ATPase